MTLDQQSIAIIGGTGALGSGLARRWASAGLSIVIGSRDGAKAADHARELARQTGSNGVAGLSNREAAEKAQIVVLTVPFASQGTILEEIALLTGGKLLLDTTVPLMPPKVARVQLPPEGSAAMRAQAILGDHVRVISGFHNVAAHKLQKDGPIACDVLIFGDDPDSRDIGVQLAAKAGLRGLHGGPLANSAAAEALTSVLISINKNYKADGAGLTITGIPQGEA